MSLINDALKRAKQAQTQAPPPIISGPPFKPVDTPSSEPRGFGFRGIVAGALALLFLGLVWTQLGGGGDSPQPVQARTPQPAAEAPPVAPVVPVPATAATTAAPAATPAASATPAPPADAAQPSQAVVPAAVELPPAPPPVKLQAIIYNPKRPSAIINGKTLFIGDKFGDLRLVALTKDTATLAGAGVSKSLSLEE